MPNLKVTAIVEMEVPTDEIDLLSALKGGFGTPIESRLVGEYVKVKSGPYENLVTGTITKIAVDTSKGAQ